MSWKNVCLTFKIKGISETLLAVYSHIGRVLQLLCRVLPISSRTFAAVGGHPHHEYRHRLRKAAAQTIPVELYPVMG